jgi:hypothetical protein
MPSEMYQRGRRDAEADALDENYYQYYYDYKLAYDEVMRNRRRTRRQLFAARLGRNLVRILPLLLLLAAASYMVLLYVDPSGEAASAGSATPMRTPRPTLPPPTPRPPATPTLELALRADSFAVITGTQGAPLRARNGPGTDQGIVTRIPEGSTVKLLEGPQEANGMQWWRVEIDGAQGWAAAPYLKPAPPP